MEKQVSNKKFKATIVSLCLGFLMVVGAIIGVWAATTQNFKAGFTVNYSVGENVAAAVRTEYYIPGSGEAAQTVTTDEDGEEVENVNGYVKFSSAETTSTKSVYIGDFALTPETPSIEFYFTVYNELASGYIQAVVGKNYTVKNNIDVQTYYYNADTFNASNSATTVSSSSWKTNTQVNNAVAEGYKMIKVVLSVDNINAAATCAGDINLSLNYSATAKNTSEIDKEKLEREYEFVNDWNEDFTDVDMIFDYLQANPSYKTTGNDLSTSGDGSIWGYIENGIFYVLSRNTIAFPENSSGMFDCCCGNISIYNCDTSKVTDMSEMFYTYNDSGKLDIITFDTSNVTDMSGMFQHRWGIHSLDLSSFDTSNVTDMSNMFNDCAPPTIYVSDLWSTESVTSSDEMFEMCYGLVGAVAYDDTKTDHTMANYTTGYLTYKAN